MRLACGFNINLEHGFQIPMVDYSIASGHIRAYNSKGLTNTT
jgi:hypothetical protein